MSENHAAKGTKRNTKQEIVACAIGLFSKKGYNETSMREIADAVSIQPGSIYNHFKSKEKILVHALDMYEKYIGENPALLKNVDCLFEHPSLENFFKCLALSFPPEEKDIYIKILHTMLQEQHRNEYVKRYIVEKFILKNERYIRGIIERMEGEGLIEPVDADAVAKLHTATIYYWSSANMMGIDKEPYFVVKNNMVDILYVVFGRLLVFRGQ